MDHIKWWNLQLESSAIAGSIERCLIDRHLSYGEISRQLEERLSKILGVKHTMLCTSGSVSLLIALKSLGVGPGDEVIVPDITFQATANAILMAGATPVLQKSEMKRDLLDIESIDQKITRNTKAIIPVHLNGRCVDITKLRAKISSKIRIIEDTAQSFYCKSNGHFAGTIGDIGCFSFGVTKFTTAGQGGLLATNNSELYSEMRKYLFQAVEKTGDIRTYNELGFNFRFTDIQAAILFNQLDGLEDRKNRYIEIYKLYKNGLERIPEIEMFDYDLKEEFPIWAEIRVSNDQRFFDYLKKSKIEAVPSDRPLHHSKYLNKTNEIELTKERKKRVLLPCGPQVRNEQIVEVVESLKRFRS